jgi:hypothetical protein
MSTNRTFPDVGTEFQITSKDQFWIFPHQEPVLAFRLRRDSEKRWGISPSTDHGYVVILKNAPSTVLDSLGFPVFVRITGTTGKLGFAELLT